MAVTSETSRPTVRVLRKDFERAITVYLCKDGSITYGPRGDDVAKPVKQAVPIFSVDTVEEAKTLQVALGSRGREEPMADRYLYDKANYTGDPADLPVVYATFKAAYTRNEGWDDMRKWIAAGEAFYGPDVFMVRHANMTRPDLDDLEPGSEEYRDRLRAGFQETTLLEKWLNRIGAAVYRRVIPAEGDVAW